MNKPKHTVLPFVGLMILILLSGGGAVGFAAYMVAAPQTQVTVEVDTPTLPSFIGQSVDEVVFYPWNRYDPDSFPSHLPEGTVDEFWPWCVRYLSDGATILGLTLANDSINRGLVDLDLCFWKDCPAQTQNGQSALLDVAYGAETWNMGWTWVARSTGDPPTRAQKEAAVAKVQQDVCALFDPQGQRGDLSMALDTLNNVLAQRAMLYHYGEPGITQQDLYASEVISSVYLPISDIAATLPFQDGQSTQQQLNALSQAAENRNYRIQVVTTQRQVVVVLTYTFSDEASWYSVGVYYDMVLEQYSGFALNSRSESGY